MRIWCALALALLLASPAGADEQTDRLERAKRTAERAHAEAGAGRYQEAARAYAEAFQLLPNAVVKYNEAESWYAAEEHPAAADAYEQALKMDTLDAERTARSKKILTLLGIKLGVLVIEQPVGGSVTIAHARGRAVPARVHLPPGQHEVIVAEPGGTRHERRVQIEQGRATPLVLPEARPEARRPEPVESDPPDPAEGRTQRIIGFCALGLGAAAGVASVVVGGLFVAKLDAFEDSGRTDAGMRSDAVTLQTWTSATAIAGGVATAIGLVLVLTAPLSDTGGDAARLHATPDGLAVSF